MKPFVFLVNFTYDFGSCQHINRIIADRIYLSIGRLTVLSNGDNTTVCQR